MKAGIIITTALMVAALALPAPAHASKRSALLRSLLDNTCNSENVCTTNLSGTLTPGTIADGPQAGSDGLSGSLIDEYGCSRTVTMTGRLDSSGNPASWQIFIQYDDIACNLIGTDGKPVVNGDNAYEFINYVETETPSFGSAQVASGTYYHPDDCMVNADTGTMSLQFVSETGNWLVQIVGAKTKPDFTQGQCEN